MSKGIYYTEIKLLKNGKLISSDWVDSIITTKTHYGEIPESFDTELIPAKELFGLGIDISNYNTVSDYFNWKTALEQKLGIIISKEVKFGLFSSKPKYSAEFDSFGRYTTKFKPYDVFQFKKKVKVIDWWTLDMVVSRLSIDECKEFLIDKGFISKNPSSEEFTRICGYIGR